MSHKSGQNGIHGNYVGYRHNGHFPPFPYKEEGDGSTKSPLGGSICAHSDRLTYLSSGFSHLFALNTGVSWVNWRLKLVLLIKYLLIFVRVQYPDIIPFSNKFAFYGLQFLGSSPRLAI